MATLRKLGVFVGEDKWTFFREIYEDLSSHFETEIYRPRTYNTPLLHGRLNRWAYRSQIQGMLRRNDVCFFEWASELLMHASHMPKRAAIVTRLHSFELYEWAPKINWDAVDKIILVSKAMRQQFAALYPTQGHKTVVVYNGRSLDTFVPPVRRNHELRLGMLCNIRPIKRIYEIVLMLYSLREQGCTPCLHIAGEATSGEELRYETSLRQLVRRLDLQEQVHFDGYVPDAQSWLHGIDVFISNSYWEGQQVALLEAMASGCYCLSHVWLGAEEMLPPGNLYVSEAELRRKIIEFAEMSESEKRDRQAQLRSLACERFDVEQSKKRIRSIVAEMIIEDGVLERA